MINFNKKNGILLLEYSSYNSGVEWISRKIDNNKLINLRRTFHFKKEDIYKPSDYENLKYLDTVIFKIAKLEGDYYKFERSILKIDSELLIHKDLELNKEVFIASKNISIFKKIDKIVDGKIIIGNEDDQLPINVFKELIDKFPNYYELKRYTSARISNIVREYLNVPTDEKEKYEKYINKKMNDEKYRYDYELLHSIAKIETKKYEVILNKLRKMLKENRGYSEKHWQKNILEILQLIYPKYIKVFSEVTIKNSKRIDYLLLDSKGTVDIIEIKKPFDKNILSANTYRDNHVPLRELSGTIMQIENYIYLLNQWGEKGEKKLLERYKNELPDNFKIKIINPNGIIIMGREKLFDGKQTNDFEIIKRKYKNVVDIITYDELLNRLEFIIYKFKNHERESVENE